MVAFVVVMNRVDVLDIVVDLVDVDIVDVDLDVDLADVDLNVDRVDVDSVDDDFEKVLRRL